MNGNNVHLTQLRPPLAFVTGIVAIFLVLTFFCMPAIGEVITVTHSVKQTFGGGQSPDDARIAAMAKAKREALEKAGTYIESLTVVKNSQVEKDEILSLAAGVLRAEVVSQKNFASDDAFGIEIVVNVVVDTSVLEERVKKQLQDKTHLKQLQDSQKREKELLLKVAELEEKNKQLVANKQSTKKISKEFQQTSRGLTAEDWFRKAAALWDGDQHTNPEKAIEYLDNVIKLEPNYASTYVNRGAVYSNLGQTQRAIEDFNKAIRLEPDNALAYYNRGAVYSKLGQTQRAIENYNEAIRLEPDYVSAYNNRGLAYTDLGQYQRAIEDCNEAIRLKPDHASAYNNRGVAYLIQGNKKMGCRDAQKACALGICKLLEFAKGEGLCR